MTRAWTSTDADRIRESEVYASYKRPVRRLLCPLTDFSGLEEQGTAWNVTIRNLADNINLFWLLHHENGRHHHCALTRPGYGTPKITKACQ